MAMKQGTPVNVSVSDLNMRRHRGNVVSRFGTPSGEGAKVLIKTPSMTKVSSFGAIDSLNDTQLIQEQQELLTTLQGNVRTMLTGRAVDPEDIMLTQRLKMVNSEIKRRSNEAILKRQRDEMAFFSKYVSEDNRRRMSENISSRLNELLKPSFYNPPLNIEGIEAMPASASLGPEFSRETGIYRTKAPQAKGGRLIDLGAYSNIGSRRGPLRISTPEGQEEFGAISAITGGEKTGKKTADQEFLIQKFKALNKQLEELDPLEDPDGTQKRNIEAQMKDVESQYKIAGQKIKGRATGLPEGWPTKKGKLIDVTPTSVKSKPVKPEGGEVDVKDGDWHKGRDGREYRWDKTVKKFEVKSLKLPPYFKTTGTDQNGNPLATNPTGDINIRFVNGQWETITFKESDKGQVWKNGQWVNK